MGFSISWYLSTPAGIEYWVVKIKTLENPSLGQILNSFPSQLREKDHNKLNKTIHLSCYLFALRHRVGEG